jgi:CspA family cold shock protein
MAQGQIKKIVADRGFGFISSEENKDIFFHFTVLKPDAGAFDGLQEGQNVEFEFEEGDKGPKATSVKVIA